MMHVNVYGSVGI